MAAAFGGSTDAEQQLGMPAHRAAVRMHALGRLEPSAAAAAAGDAGPGRPLHMNPAASSVHIPPWPELGDACLLPGLMTAMQHVIDAHHTDVATVAGAARVLEEAARQLPAMTLRQVCARCPARPAPACLCLTPSMCSHRRTPNLHAASSALNQHHAPSLTPRLLWPALAPLCWLASGHAAAAALGRALPAPGPVRPARRPRGGRAPGPGRGEAQAGLCVRPSRGPWLQQAAGPAHALRAAVTRHP
jgi:hypothetical protein